MTAHRTACVPARIDMYARVDFTKNWLLRTGTKAFAVSRFNENCLPRIGCKELPRFREKYRTLGRHVCEIRDIGGQIMGSNMRPWYIQFRDTRLLYIGSTLYWERCSLYWNKAQSLTLSPYTPLHSKVVGAVYWFHSVCPFRIQCPLCSTCSYGWIHFIFIHLINQLQVCRV